MRKKLILVRHAKSSWTHPCLDDEERPLSVRGRKDAPRMAAWLRDAGYAPDCLLSSPASRALSTARIFAQTLGFPLEQLCLSEAIYEADPPCLLAVIRSARADCRQLMLFGHNPGLTLLANLLCATDIDNLPTCAVLVADLQVARWADIAAGCARLEQFIYPKKLNEVDAS